MRGLYQAGSSHARRRRRDRGARAATSSGRSWPTATRRRSAPYGRGCGLTPLMAPLQAALPREHYVDAAGVRGRARAGAAPGRGPASAGSTELGLRAPGRLAVVDVLGESVLLTVDKDGALHGALQRVPAPRVAGRAGRPGRPTPAPCRASGAALPVPLVDLRPGRLAAVRAAHRGRRGLRPPAGFGLHPVAVDDVGRLRVGEPGRRRRSRRCADELGAGPGPGARATRSTRSSSAGGWTYDVAANWKVLAENYNECYHCGPVHPELVRLVPAFGRGGQDLDWDGGIPHREGAWTFTAVGHLGPGPLPRAWTRTSRSGTRASWSTRTCCCRCRPTTSRRSGWSRRGGPHPGRLRPAVRRRRGGQGRLRPVGRRGLLGPGEPAGLGDLRVGAARHVLARLPAGLVRADGGRVARHPPVAAAPARTGTRR